MRIYITQLQMLQIPMRRQNFAGTLHMVLRNILDLVICLYILYHIFVYMDICIFICVSYLYCKEAATDKFLFDVVNC